MAIGLSSELFEVFFFIEHHLCSNADYKSTDYRMKPQFEYILIIMNLLQNSLARRACETFDYPQRYGQGQRCLES
ncbi:MAG: hypothetical protein C4B58_14935 [Deltaproteobacteria bacterium]|nr:MAG: hypothetical protein C4B58_14935 [Deltaproteobacteria bacterium]